MCNILTYIELSYSIFVVILYFKYTYPSIYISSDQYIVTVKTNRKQNIIIIKIFTEIQSNNTDNKIEIYIIFIRKSTITPMKPLTIYTSLLLILICQSTIIPAFFSVNQLVHCLRFETNDIQIKCTQCKPHYKLVQSSCLQCEEYDKDIQCNKNSQFGYGGIYPNDPKQQFVVDYDKIVTKPDNIDYKAGDQKNGIQFVPKNQFTVSQQDVLANNGNGNQKQQSDSNQKQQQVQKQQQKIVIIPPTQQNNIRNEGQLELTTNSIQLAPKLKNKKLNLILSDIVPVFIIDEKFHPTTNTTNVGQQQNANEDNTTIKQQQEHCIRYSEIIPATGNRKCEQCKPGYIINKLAQIQQQSSCIQVSGPVYFSQALRNQFKMIDPNCEVININLKLSSPSLFDNEEDSGLSQKCGKCKDQYLYSKKQDKCIARDPFCQVYSEYGQCFQCQKGFQMKNEGQNCQPI